MHLENRETFAVIHSACQWRSLRTRLMFIVLSAKCVFLIFVAIFP